MPRNSPAGPIIALPPHNGWDGAVKIASSRTYSQLPANSCLAAMRAATERLRPPAPRDHDGLTHLGGLRLADRQRRQVDPRQRLHQSEAALLVIGEHVPGNAAAVARCSQTVSASMIR